MLRSLPAFVFGTFLLTDHLALAPADPAPAKPRASAAVVTLIKRAAKEPHETAFKTLVEAEELARSESDAALMEVGDAWNDRGVDLLNGGEAARAREFLLRALAICERVSPESVATAETLVNLGGVA